MTKSPITTTAVRQLLKLWDSADQLGRHELANLLVVAVRQAEAGHAPTTVGRGLALKAVLSDALESLRPDEQGEPDPTQKAWRPYIIITERYCYGRIPDWIMMQLHIANRTFYKEMRRGVQQVVARLQHWEETTPAALVAPEAITPPNTAVQAPETTLLAVPPLPHHAIVGRETAVAQVRRWLIRETDAPTAVVGAHGLPGVGKSTLAALLALDTAVRDFFTAGVVWLGVGRTPDVHELLLRLARQVGLNLTDTQQNGPTAELAALVRGAFLGKKYLLILDDVWDAAVGRQLCVGGQAGKHLITSRHPAVALELAGAQTYHIEPLPLAESRALLTQLAPNFADLAEVGEVLTAVGGLPIALLMVGKQLHQQGYAGQQARLNRLLAQLRQRETRLDLPLWREFGAEQVSLAAVLGQSVADLEPSTAQTLRELALLPPQPNSFSHEMGVVLADGAETHLFALVDCGLLEPVGEDRYTLHQLVHDYLLVYGGEAVQRGALQRYLAQLALAQEQNYGVLAQEMENVSAVLAWPEVEPILAAQMVFGLTPFWLDRGRTAVVTRYLAVLDPITPPDPIAQLYVQGARARLAAWQEDGAAALRLFTAVGEAAQTHGLTELHLVCQLALVQGHLQNGDPKAAYEVALPLLARVDEHQSMVWRADAHRLLSGVHYYRGDYEAARREVMHAKRLYERLHDTLSLGRVAQNLGAIAVAQGRYSVGQAQYDQAEAYYLEAESRYWLGSVRNNIGVLALNLGQWQAAWAYHEAALAARREVEDMAGQVQSHLNLMVVALSCKDLVAAERHLAEGLAIAEVRNYYVRVAKLRINASWLARLQGDWARAERESRAALSRAEEIGHGQSVGDALVQLGRAMAGRGDTAVGLTHLQRAQEMWLAQKQNSLQVETEAYLAQVEAQRGNLTAARSWLVGVIPHLRQTTDGFEDVIELFLICEQVLRRCGELTLAWEMAEQGALALRQQATQVEDVAGFVGFYEGLRASVEHFP